MCTWRKANSICTHDSGTGAVNPVNSRHSKHCWYLWCSTHAPKGEKDHKLLLPKITRQYVANCKKWSYTLFRVQNGEFLTGETPFWWRVESMTALFMGVCLGPGYFTIVVIIGCLLHLWWVSRGARWMPLSLPTCSCGSLCTHVQYRRTHRKDYINCGRGIMTLFWCHFHYSSR